MSNKKKLLIIGGNNPVLLVYDLVNDLLIHMQVLHQLLTAIQISPCEEYLALGFRGGEAQLLKIQYELKKKIFTSQVLQQLNKKIDIITDILAIEFAPNSDMLAISFDAIHLHNQKVTELELGSWREPFPPS